MKKVIQIYYLTTYLIVFKKNNKNEYLLKGN